MAFRMFQARVAGSWTRRSELFFILRDSLAASSQRVGQAIWVGTFRAKALALKRSRKLRSVGQSSASSSSSWSLGKADALTAFSIIGLGRARTITSGLAD